MKQEMITQLVTELFNSIDELHETYEDNNVSYAIDAQKKDNVLNITISLNKNKDKKEFEEWVKDLDDDIFQKTWENISESHGSKNINDIYESSEYKNVIDLFKNEAKKVAQEKINKLTKILGL